MPPDYDAAVPPPSSRQEFVETLHRMIGDAGEDVGEPFLGIEVGELGGPNERVNQRPRSAPRSDQANNHDLRLCRDLHKRNYAQPVIMRSSRVQALHAPRRISGIMLSLKAPLYA
jgi:hypothetical protein